MILISETDCGEGKANPDSYGFYLLWWANEPNWPLIDAANCNALI